MTGWLKGIFGDGANEESTQSAQPEVTKGQIFIAIKKRQDITRLLEQFITQGGDINAVFNSNNGYTLLHYAVKYGNVSAIGPLMNKGAKVILSKKDGTPLHIAVNSVASDIISANEKREVESIYKNEERGVREEKIMERVERIRVIAIKAIFDGINTPEDKKSLETQLNGDNLTAAMAAILRGNKEALDTIFRGPGFTWQYRASGNVYSAHELAAQSLNPLAYYQILERGVIGDKRADLILTKDYLKKNCLDYAIEHRKVEAVKFLLGHAHSKQAPKETMESLLQGEQFLRNQGLEESDMYTLVIRELDRMGHEFPISELRDANIEGVLTTLGAVQELEGSSLGAAEEFRSTGSASAAASAEPAGEESDKTSRDDTSSNSQSDDEMPPQVPFNVPEYNAAAINSEIESRTAIADELLAKWQRDRSTVARDADAVRGKKVAALEEKKQQQGYEGREGAAEAIDAERAKRLKELKQNQIDGVISPGEARKLAQARERNAAAKPAPSWTSRATDAKGSIAKGWGPS